MINIASVIVLHRLREYEFSKTATYGHGGAVIID